MSTYRVEIRRSAIKSLARLERNDQLRIRAALDLLANDPRPPNCTKLAGEESVYRVRVGNYRVLYEVHDHRLVILVIRIGHRRDVYRDR